MAGLLDGIRVIDFGRYVAAPYCGMMLADFGADVIRVDRIGGSEDRYLGPLAETGEGGFYLSINRNKRGLTLDLAKPEAAEVVRRLIASADLVIANMPLPVLKKAGLDYVSLQGIKADIILVMITTFGPDGPYAGRAGFDTIAQAMSGAMSLTGFPGPPVRSLVPFEDFGTALHAAFGAMAALLHRERTGQGQLVDASLLATGVTFMQPYLAEWQVKGIDRRQQGNTSYWASPSDVYQTADGWLVAAVIGGPMFARWARLVGREEMLDDARFSSDLGRADHHELVGGAMREWCRTRCTEAAIAALEEARIPAGPVYRLPEVLDDRQVRARELLRYLPFPGAAGDIPIADTPVRLSRAGGQVRGRAPTVGEHTEEILAELGYSAAQIEALRDAGVV